MSLSVHSNSENILLNGYSYFFAASGNREKFPSSCPIRVGCNASYFSSSATLSCCTDNTLVTSDYKFSTLDWQDQTAVENINHIFAKDLNNLERKYLNVRNEENQRNPPRKTGDKPILWRPFSTQEDKKGDSAVLKRTSNRNLFYSIKPSSVKIGSSRWSVFKAVKKNTFPCTQCPSRYVSNRQLNSHMRVHTGSKPFRCEYQNCFKSFARNEELTRHKRIHSGFKPHQCATCKKRFGRKDHLSKHLKTHLQTDEKKVYQCSFQGCGHRYTRSDALTRHKSTAHALKNPK